ncbi:MAG: hypothetical protein ACLR4Z_01590 [Butyricicoccaceae bacterium]
MLITVLAENSHIRAVGFGRGNSLSCFRSDRAAADLRLLYPHADAAVHALRRPASVSPAWCSRRSCRS